MKRRTFLQQLGYSVPATFALPYLLTSCRKKEDDDGISTVDKYKNYKVIVVGAGAAGLYAGWYLKERGFDVTILEASGKIGGRVRPLSGFADEDIELGAEEIHGSNSEWYRIATQQVGAELQTGETEDYFFFKQDPLNPNEPALKNESQANQYEEFLKTTQFVEDAYTWSGEDKTVENVLASSGISWNMFGVANGMLGNEYGTSNNRLSIKGLAEESNLWSSGEESYGLKTATMLSILETKFAPVLGKVVKNTQVKKVDYQGEKITMTDQTGKTWQADRLVITVPLKILQDGDIVFTPGLPSTKIDAINHIGIGAGMKGIFKFSQPFWENSLVSNLGSIIGYNEVPELWVGRGSTPTLTAFIMGEKAEQFSAMSMADAKGTLLGHLNNIFGSNIASQSILDDGFYLMDWSKEPFIRGAYSYPMVGGGLIFRKELASDIDGRIFFAGEATHFEGHSGTVHGAIETGIRAVAEVEESIS
ncbi:MAG: FAD-dependent oxidoreductase [Bacteroidetes bacterium]|nr:FAD-dependent oxidoreductase [Bacteroidota bacterium]